MATRTSSVPGVPDGIPLRHRCRLEAGRRPVAPEPPDVAAERLGEQGERGGEGGAGEGDGQDAGCRDRQRDALRRRDHLAPVAAGQRRAHPPDQPPGGQERVACDTDQEHPPAGRGSDVHGQCEDQERVDLAVPARAQGRLRPGAPRDVTVDVVERQRGGRERHQRRGLRRAAERVGGQRRDADGQRRPHERHPPGRADPLRAVAQQAVGQRGVHGHAAGEPDEPPGETEADRRPKCGQQQHLGGQPDQRATLSRPQRASVLEHTKGRYRGWGESVLSDARPGGALVRQDERAPFAEALQRARQSAYAPGEYIEQESFMRAGEIRTLAERAGIAGGVPVLDLCCGVAGPGRFIARELGCDYLGVDYSASAIDIARARCDGLPCRFEVARVPPLPRGTFEVVLLLETMLAFADKPPLLDAISGALARRRAIRVHARGGPAADRLGARRHARRRHGLADPAGGDEQAAGAGPGWSSAGRRTAACPTAPWRTR